MALGLRRFDIFLAQAGGVNSFENCVVLDKCCWLYAVPARTIGILSDAFTSMTRDQSRQQWWLEPVVCTYSCEDQLQVSIKCQEKVAETHTVVRARVGSKGQGEL